MKSTGVREGPSSNLTRKSGCGPGLWELPEIRGFPFNISATASDFKFGEPLGFAKAHDKITQKKGWARPELGEVPKIRGFPSIFTQ